MKFKYVLILFLPVFMIIGCDDDSPTAAVDPCPALQTDADTKIATFVEAMDAATCAPALAAVTALKDGSCNASPLMMSLEEETVTWPVDAEDVSDVQEMCDAISAGAP